MHSATIRRYRCSIALGSLASPPGIDGILCRFLGLCTNRGLKTGSVTVEQPASWNRPIGD
jgi:hypothetical protein